MSLKKKPSKSGPKYGEVPCEKVNEKGECKNRAYWLVKDPKKEGVVYLCGVHSKNNSTRKALPKRSAKEKAVLLQAKYAEEDQTIEEARLQNEKRGLWGRVMVTKLRIMKPVEDIPGYRKIFPNFKHKNRKDGIGLPGLSPKSLGPVKHNQGPRPYDHKKLPPSKNLENLHQGNKVFPCDTLKRKGSLIPTDQWYEQQRKYYLDPVPHRHQEAALEVGKGVNKNVPAFSVWFTPQGEELHLTYIESRQIYCTYFDRLIRDTEDYTTLIDLISNGTNIQIVGYDGFDLGFDSSGKRPSRALLRKRFDEWYLDPSRPFGHELVLAAILLLEEEDYPWVTHRTLDL